MENNIVYHGSNVVVAQPKILINGHYKEFGFGFYCTNIENQAKRWALPTRGASSVKYKTMILWKGLWQTIRYGIM